MQRVFLFDPNLVLPEHDTNWFSLLDLRYLGKQAGCLIDLENHNIVGILICQQ